MTLDKLCSNGEQMVRDMAQAKAAAGADWNRERLVDFTNGWLVKFAADSQIRKPRKKADKGDVSALEPIYLAYPRKVAPVTAYRAISAALTRCTYAELLKKTLLYAECVKRWPANFRFVNGRDTVPHPATWFNRGSYAESEAEWIGPNGKPTDFVKAPFLTEPEGWQAEFPDCIYPTWDVMPHSTQLHICTVMAMARKLKSQPPEPESRPGLLFPRD